MRTRDRPKSAPRSRSIRTVKVPTISSHHGSSNVRQRPQSASSCRGGGGSRRQRPTSAKGERRQRHQQEDAKVLVAMEKVVVGLVQENRLVEAVTLAHKLTKTACSEAGSGSAIFRHCTKLTVKLTLELSERQEECGEACDIGVALEYLNGALALIGASCPGLPRGMEEEEDDDDEKEHGLASPTGSSDMAWKEECLGFRACILACMAACFRRVDDFNGADRAATNALETARRINQRLIRLMGNKDAQGKLIRSVREAEGRCHLILCTIVSFSADHVRAFKHARVAASILEDAIPSKGRSGVSVKTRLDRMIVKSLGIAYYNIGAELEHVIQAGGDGCESLLMDHEQEAEKRSMMEPEYWYKKALFLARKLPHVFPKDLILAFESTAQTCADQKQIKKKATSNNFNTSTVDAQIHKKKKKKKKKKKNNVEMGMQHKIVFEQKQQQAMEDEESENELLDPSKPTMGDIEAIATLLQGLKLTGKTWADFLSECRERIMPGARDKLSADAFMKILAHYCNKEVATRLVRRYGTFSTGVDLAVFQIVCQEAFLNALTFIVSKMDAPIVLNNFGKRSADSMLSFAQIVQGLQQSGIKLSKTEATILLETIQVHPKSLIQFSAIFDALGEAAVQDDEVEQENDDDEDDEYEEDYEDEEKETVVSQEQPKKKKSIDWERFDENNYCNEEKLDLLDDFDVGSIVQSFDKEMKKKQEQQESAAQAHSSKKPRKLAKLKSNNSKQFLLEKERVQMQRRNRAARMALSKGPVPMTIAGFRTLQNDVISQRNLVSDDGKTIKWPPMVRASELNALLVPSRKKQQQQNNLPTTSSTTSRQEPPTEEDSISFAPSSWSTKLKSLRATLNNNT